ncbi:MAG: hypothetical protein AAF957_12825 [Planctomycetota bacterium]
MTDASGFRVWAGLDEAGYGPLLGPLTIGVSAFRGAPPVDWSRLADAVTDEPSGDRDRLVVADSKRVYTRNPRGARRLETTALTFLAAAGRPARTPDDLLASAPPALRPSPDPATHPWYAALAERLPVHADAEDLAARASALTEALARVDVEVATAGVAVVPSGSLNASFAATNNKGATLWSYHSTALLHLFEEFGHEGLDVVCDRLGGRARYGRGLSALIPFSTVRVEAESRLESRYLVTANDRRMRVRFVQKGDTSSLPTALASCLAKYARELVMDAFNAHFARLCPDVRPTAGYVTDARRWLQDVEAARPEALRGLDSLVRTR